MGEPNEIRIRAQRHKSVDAERVAHALVALLDELDPATLGRLSREGAAILASLEDSEAHAASPEAEAC